MKRRGRSTRFRKAAVGALVCAAVAALGAVLISAASEDPDAVPTSSQVASRVMSPFCPGLSLDECPSGQSTRLRTQIEDRIAGGATNSEIDRWLVDNYGESVLSRPPQAVSWMVPAAFVLAGLGAVSFFLSRGESRVKELEAPAAETAEGAEEARYRAQMTRDLSAFSRGTE